MAKQLMEGERASVGDWIQNDQTKQKWIAQQCPTCIGSGGVNDGWRYVNCSKCDGLKIIWKEVKYVV